MTFLRGIFGILYSIFLFMAALSIMLSGLVGMIVFLSNITRTIREKGLIKTLGLTIAVILLSLLSVGLGWYFAKDEISYVKDTAIYLYHKVFSEKPLANEWKKIELEEAGTIYLPPTWKIIKRAQEVKENFFSDKDKCLNQVLFLAQNTSGQPAFLMLEALWLEHGDTFKEIQSIFGGLDNYLKLFVSIRNISDREIIVEHLSKGKIPTTTFTLAQSSQHTAECKIASLRYKNKVLFLGLIYPPESRNIWESMLENIIYRWERE